MNDIKKTAVDNKKKKIALASAGGAGIIAAAAGGAMLYTQHAKAAEVEPEEADAVVEKVEPTGDAQPASVAHHHTEIHNVNVYHHSVSDNKDDIVKVEDKPTVTKYQQYYDADGNKIMEVAEVKESNGNSNIYIDYDGDGRADAMVANHTMEDPMTEDDIKPIPQSTTVSMNDFKQLASNNIEQIQLDISAEAGTDTADLGPDYVNDADTSDYMASREAHNDVADADHEGQEYADVVNYDDNSHISPAGVEEPYIAESNVYGEGEIIDANQPEELGGYASNEVESSDFQGEVYDAPEMASVDYNQPSEPVMTEDPVSYDAPHDAFDDGLAMNNDPMADMGGLDADIPTDGLA